MNLLNTSAITSLILQVITGVIESFGLTFNVKQEDTIVQEILAVELFVQLIEFLFYCYLVYKIIFDHVGSSITSHRYLDWNITTPVMLINFAVFFRYLSDRNRKTNRYLDIVKEEFPTLSKIVVANFLMLLFGYLGELHILPTALSTAIGFIPFAYIFKQVYSNYVSYDNISYILFYVTFFIWGLYGVAAVLSFQVKNTFYNILDLIAKNAYGLFLFFYLQRIQI